MMEETLERVFEWPTIFNQLKSMKCLIEIVELEQPDLARQIEDQLSNMLSTLSAANQQRIKNFALVRAGINPNVTTQTFNVLKYELDLRFKSGSALYDFISNEIHEPLEKFKWMIVAAEKGLAEAQVFVAWCFLNAQCGSPQNVLKAKYWYAKASKQNNVEAQHALDYLSHHPIYKITHPFEKEGNGDDLFTSSMKSLQNMLTTTPNNKNEIADIKCTIGQCYEYGYGIAIDCKKAYEYYTQANGHGNNRALLELAFMYDQDSDDNPLTIKQCFEFLYKAAERKENTCAREGLAYALNHKKYGSIRPQESFKWRTMAAEEGDAFAMYNLGLLYYNGPTEEQKKKFDLLKDEEKATRLFIAAATKGELDSCWFLSMINLEKYKDTKSSLEWLKWGAIRGNPDCQHSLGQWIENDGKESPVGWYLKAANRGNDDAFLSLGQYYDECKLDRISAIKWYTVGANKGHAGCQYALGKLYHYGSIQEKKMGREWMIKAAEEELPEAILWLKRNPLLVPGQTYNPCNP